MTTQGQRYWRSLDRLLDSPAVREQLANEYPEGASLPPEGFTRRGMLKLMGASFALAGLASCRRPEELIVPFVAAPEELVPGVPKHYATTMPFGTSAYGLLVESHDGRPTKIEGNELHPSSRGAASSWMQASVLDLYDPDRSRHVIRREPGGQRKDSSWEDFLSFWTEVAASAVETGGAGLAVLTEAYSSPSIARLAGLFREHVTRRPACRPASCQTNPVRVFGRGDSSQDLKHATSLPALTRLWYSPLRYPCANILRRRAFRCSSISESSPATS